MLMMMMNCYDGYDYGNIDSEDPVESNKTIRNFPQAFREQHTAERGPSDSEPRGPAAKGQRPRAARQRECGTAHTPVACRKRRAEAGKDSTTQRSLERGRLQLLFELKTDVLVLQCDHVALRLFLLPLGGAVVQLVL